MPRKSRTAAPAIAAAAEKASGVWNTAVYARLSFGDGQDKESDSLENQIYLVKQYIMIRADLNLSSVYSDDGETGTNFDRPGFNALMDDVRAGRINCIVVKDLSRFGRNYIEAGEYLEKILPFMGVRFISVNDGLDNRDANSNTTEMIVSLKNLINDVYAKDISQKIISALRTKQEKGDYIGGHPIYGYKKYAEDCRKLVVDDEVAHIVRDIFKWKAEGMGDVSIAKMLNGKGIPSPLKRKLDRGEIKSVGHSKTFIWRSEAISRMTTNPMYIGHMTQGKTKQALCDNKPIKLQAKTDWIVVENTHEAIVDKATFDKAQEMRHTNTKEFYRNYDKSKHIKTDKHLFKGLLVCGGCGSKLTRKKMSDAGDCEKHMFICPIGYRGMMDACRLKCITESALYATALSAIKVQVAAAADLTSLVEKLNRKAGGINRKDDIAKQMIGLQSEIKRLSNLKAALFESYTDKLLSEDEYIYSKNRYAKQGEDAQAKLVRLQEERAIRSETLTQQNKWLQAFRRFTDHDELSHDMVKTLVIQVVVNTKAEFDFIWNFKSEYDALCEYAIASAEPADTSSMDCSQTGEDVTA